MRFETLEMEDKAARSGVGVARACAMRCDAMRCDSMSRLTLVAAGDTRWTVSGLFFSPISFTSTRGLSILLLCRSLFCSIFHSLAGWLADVLWLSVAQRSCAAELHVADLVRIASLILVLFSFWRLSSAREICPSYLILLLRVWPSLPKELRV